MKKTILTVLLVLMLLFIWGHSMVPAEASAAESGRVGALLTPFLELFVGKGNVTDHLVRKLAHFSEYAALSVLLGAQLLVHGRTSLFHWSYVLLCALAAAVTDETIQLFVEGRGAQVQDVLLDLGGSAAGLLLLWLLSRIVRHLRR